MDLGSTFESVKDFTVENPWATVIGLAALYFVATNVIGGKDKSILSKLFSATKTSAVAGGAGLALSMADNLVNFDTDNLLSNILDPVPGISPEPS